MKHYLLVLLSFSSALSFAQNPELEVTKTNLTFNSWGTPRIQLELSLDFPGKDETLDDDDFLTINSSLNPTVRDADGIQISGSQVTVDPMKGNRLAISIQGLTQKQLRDFAADGNKFYVDLPNDIKISSLAPHSKNYIISKQKIKDITTDELQLQDEFVKEMIDKMGGEIYGIQNMIDFGISPKEETGTGKSEYYLKYGYRTSYSVAAKKIFFFSEGLISTSSDDTLNFVNIYPVNYKLGGKTNELVGQLGIEGNQRFTNWRASGNFYWQGLTPNFVNLTMGESRLRLKPVVKVGFKFYQEFENTRIILENASEDEETFSTQIFTELYYNIPIKKLYSITLQGNAFYDFNENVNPEKELMYNYSVTLGLEVPKTPIKTIFKYAAGANGINYEYDSMLIVGFMADIFSFRQP